jgi:hypothetical protein
MSTTARTAPLSDPISHLADKYPDWKETLDFIAQLRQTARQYPLPDFFEPLALVQLEDKKATLAQMSPGLLVAWIGHMSNGARARMEILEDQILSGLADGALLVPAILTRCHLEVAGFAAYSNKMLLKFAEKRDYEALKADILQTAYSSAMVSKDDPATLGLIPGAYSPPRSVMIALDALQWFFDIAAEPGYLNIRKLYAMLCDFGHPSILGLRGFVQVVDQTASGRTLQYRREETLETADAVNLLTALIWSMRGGHTNAVLMRCGEVIEQDDGGFIYQRPDRDSGRAIQEDFLQKPLPPRPE